MSWSERKAEVDAQKARAATESERRTKEALIAMDWSKPCPLAAGIEESREWLEQQRERERGIEMAKVIKQGKRKAG